MVATIDNLKTSILEMAEETKSIFTSNTMIPVSLVTGLISLIVGAVMAFTSIRKDVDHTVNAVLNMGARVTQMEKEYVRKDEMNYKLDAIQDDLKDIKERLKK